MKAQGNIKRISWRKWIVLEEFSYYSPRYKKTLTAHKDFIFDGYTLVPNLPDLRPAKIHDIAYEKKTWDDGTPITRKEADMMFLDLMKESESKCTRIFAGLYYRGVRTLSGMFW